MRSPWIIAQLAAAAVLLVLSAIGLVGYFAFDAAEAVFSFAGFIQAFAIFPGLVVSLVANAMLMRRPLPSRALKILVVIELAFIATLVLYHFYTDEAGNTLGLAIATWPVVIGLAIAIAIVAGVRRARTPRVTVG